MALARKGSAAPATSRNGSYNGRWERATRLGARVRAVDERDDGFILFLGLMRATSTDFADLEGNRRLPSRRCIVTGRLRKAVLAACDLYRSSALDSSADCRRCLFSLLSARCSCHRCAAWAM
ncbi:hypothetical protein E2562_015201 [Oryza meyeriana var. granulata]|uniref:Uncharacterized protein n=1 Tax=Oryza meyeriana var. granulata TaxID=110450 RepID=A0A6G1EWV8_9ORYZ|nr:hypothetical protein E2562_015201 [Oryza meyeriana var. granulata]